MYTRCPDCRTVFKITEAQLIAREGRVRCGKCAAVFHAEQHLFNEPPAIAAQEPTQASDAARGGGDAETTERKPVPVAVATDPGGIPTVTELTLLARPGRRIPLVFWALGDVALLLLLGLQLAYFYRDELAQYPELRPPLLAFCERLDCEIRERRDVSQVEILEQTRIAPHPKYENVLRIHVVLVNRAAYAQNYPLIEVGLTDSGGNLLARRAFSPGQYLEPSAVEGRLLPNIVASAQLNVTNPNNKAVGYEVRLVTPP